MAKLVDSVVESQKVNFVRPIWKAALIGILTGIFYWAVTKLFQKYNLSLEVSGNVATILAAVFGVILLVVSRVEQPLIIAVAVAACLWGLSAITASLDSGSVITWAAVLYGLGYSALFWVTRYTNIFSVLIMTLVIVLAMRLIAVL